MFATLALVSMAAVAAGQVQLKPAAGLKSQSEVASKAKFKVIPEKAPELKTALEAHDLKGAAKLSGKQGAFYGVVDSVVETKGHSVLFLDFDKDFKRTIAAVLLPSHYADLPDMRQIKSHKVLVSGKYVMYNGRAEILISTVDQVKIVQTK